MVAQFDIGMLISQISFASMTVFWIWMMIDALIKQTSLLPKVLWFIGILLFYFLGALIYFFVARKNSPRETILTLGVIVISAIGALAWIFF